jgi:hypothetical protein
MSTTAANETFTTSDQTTIAFTRHPGLRPGAQIASELRNLVRRA